MTPNQIYDVYLGFRKYDKMIRDAYFRKREKETPFLRDVKVYWHVGVSGSGKSFTASKLLDKYGEDSLYLVTDYENGGLDKYNGEPVLFLDEFRGQIRYSTLLSMLQGYKQQFHARYTNIIGLWNEVHITSVLPPELIYSNMVENYKEFDTIQQLLRRITSIIYHYKINGDYKEFELPIEEYKKYDDLKNRVNSFDF